MGREHTAEAAAEKPGRSSTVERPRPRATLGDSAVRLTAAILVAMVAIPPAVAGISLVGRPWTPIGDEAAIAVRVADIGSAATPLVGAYSTHGWAHPGPVLFLLLALPYRLSGGADWSLFVGTALLNSGMIALIGLLAWRRGQLPMVAITMIGAAFLVHGIRPDILIWFWNPYVPLLPYVVFLFAAWSIACRDWVVLPVAVGIGSALVQLHVAYATLVIATAVVTALWLRFDARGFGSEGSETVKTVPNTAAGATTADLDPRLVSHPRFGGKPERRTTVVSLGVLAVLWTPVVVDLLFGSHNLVQVGGYFVRSKSQTTGAMNGLGILSRHLGPTAPWSGGDEQMSFGNVQPGSLLALMVLLGLLLGLFALAIRLGNFRTGALLALTLGQVVAAGAAASRLEEPLLAYLVVWMLPLAMIVWVTLAWAVTDLLVRPQISRWGHHLLPGLRRFGTVGLVLVVLTVEAAAVVATGPNWIDPPLPRQERATAIASIDHQLADRLLPGDARVAPRPSATCSSRAAWASSRRSSAVDAPSTRATGRPG